MTSVVIKAGESNAAAVRSFTGADLPAAPVKVDSERELLCARIISLEQGLAERTEENARLREGATAAFEQGKKTGHEAGLLAADARADERRALLQDGIDQALAVYQEHRLDIERLAVLIARECIDRIFGDRLDRGEQLRAAISHQLDELDPRNIVEISVSETDLDEIEPLDGGANRAPSVTFRSDRALRSGEVRIQLLLGELSVGAGQQWERLRATFDDLVQAAE